MANIEAEIRKLTYKPGDVFILTTPGRTLSRQNGDALQQMCNILTRETGHPPLLIWLAGEMDLASFDEKAMAANGWQRIPGFVSPHLPRKPASEESPASTRDPPPRGDASASASSPASPENPPPSATTGKAHGFVEPSESPPVAVINDDTNIPPEA